MKRVFSLTLILSLVFALCVPCAGAANTLDLIYDLTVDVSDTATVKPGDIVTVSFRIQRADAATDNFSIRVLQNEIIYDQNFYEYVPGSAKAVKGGANALFLAVIVIYRSRLAVRFPYKGDFSNPLFGNGYIISVVCVKQGCLLWG